MAAARAGILWTVGLLAAVALAGCADDAPASGQEAPTETLPVFTSKAPRPSSTLFAPPPEPPTEPPVDVHLFVKVVGAYPMDAQYEINNESAPAGHEITAPAGSRLHVLFRNEDTGLPVTGTQLYQHSWFIRGVPESSVGTWDSGEEANTTFMAPSEPGSYEYYCTIADNRERGMTGTITFT